jgi:hypothetical protein
MCMDNQPGTLPMLTPVNGSGVFIDGEQSYELAMVPVDVPVQDFIGAGVSEIQAFDPYNPAGLDLAVQQEQKWALDDNSGWTNEWRGDMQVDSWNANWAPAW